MRISNVNIRATAFPEFWGQRYAQSLNLWESTKHNGSLQDILQSDIPTRCEDFVTQAEIEVAHNFCKNFYYKSLANLSQALNTLNACDLSVDTWRIVFGYWLYRHICIIYDKFITLRDVDLEHTDIRLLDKSDFHVPKNHMDYIFCFASDFGVQQLVSQYYFEYGQVAFPTVRKTYPCPSSNLSRIDLAIARVERCVALTRNDPEVALFGVYFSPGNREKLRDASQGRVGELSLPVVTNDCAVIDWQNRARLAARSQEFSEDGFEDFFWKSLYYCLPMDLLENFRACVDLYSEDIKARKFQYIVNENWISGFREALYIGLARQYGKTFVSSEHGTGSYYYKNFLHFIEFDAADIYLSSGWQESRRNFVQGGFACRDIAPYQPDPMRQDILYIGRTKFLYWEEFNEYNATGSVFVREMRLTSEFIDCLSDEVRSHFRFRPRMESGFWDVERILELQERGIQVDRSNFTASLLRAKLIVIDHMTTGLSEILFMNVPFLLLYDISVVPYSEQQISALEALRQCGVLHTCAQAAAAHVQAVYSSVDEWWARPDVRAAVERLFQLSLAGPEKTTDFVLSLCQGAPAPVLKPWAKFRAGGLLGALIILKIARKLKAVCMSCA